MLMFGITVLYCSGMQNLFFTDIKKNKSEFLNEAN